MEQRFYNYSSNGLKNNSKNIKNHKNLNCFNCNKLGHIRKNYPERLKNRQTPNNAALADQSFKSAEVLGVSTNASH